MCRTSVRVYVCHFDSDIELHACKQLKWDAQSNHILHIDIQSLNAIWYSLFLENTFNYYSRKVFNVKLHAIIILLKDTAWYFSNY